MSARASYLSKYLSGNDAGTSETKKKEKKRLKSLRQKPSPTASSPTTAITIGKTPGALQANTTAGLDITNPANAEDEFLPATIETQAVLEPSGFKRIDTGKTVEVDLKPSTSIDIQSLQQAQTVYRDLSGRVVAIDERRAELQAQKKADEAAKALETEQINTGEADKIRREKDAEKLASVKRYDVSKTDSEYADYMNSKDHFDDPMANFTSTQKAPEVSVAGRPNYEGGLQPENRFKIKAGHFWDGIDRSNGFEEKVVEARRQIHIKKVADAAEKETYTEYDFD